MPSFQKKPVTINAMQWDGTEAVGLVIQAAFGSGVQVHPPQQRESELPPRLFCATLEGLLAASPGDWIIQGVKGEVYPCKPDIFDATYRKVSGNMNFGEALEALKTGRRVARAGWNSKEMWLCYVSGAAYDVGVSVVGGTEKLLPWIGMKTADNGFVPWLASQTDILANDWDVVG